MFSRQTRDDEVTFLKQIAMWKAMNFGISIACPTIAALAVFTPYILVSE